MNSFVAEVWQAYQESVPGSVAREGSCGQAETIKELPTNKWVSRILFLTLLISEIKVLNTFERSFIWPT